MPQYLTLTPADGSAAIALTVPTSWADVTLAQYLALLTAPDALCVLLGLDADTLGRLAADDAVYLATCLAFATDPTALTELPATPGLPDVGQANYGLLLLATQYIESQPEGTPGLACAPYLYALYMSHAVWGKVDEGKVGSALAHVLAQPVSAVYADVAHFIRGWRAATSATKRPRKTPSSPKTLKSRLDWRNWGRGSGHSSRSTAPPKACG